MSNEISIVILIICLSSDIVIVAYVYQRFVDYSGKPVFNAFHVDLLQKDFDLCGNNAQRS